MTGIQLIAILVALLMGYMTYTSYRRRELRGSEFGVWIAIWAGVVVVSLIPDRLRAVIAPLAVARLLDLIVIAGMLVLGAVVFNLNRSLRRLENRLESLVQRLALDSARPTHDAPEEEVREASERAGNTAGGEDVTVGQSSRPHP
jgi:hypothetical protein